MKGRSLTKYKMKVKARLPTGAVIEISVSESESILDLKKAISANSGITAEEMRLVIKGRIVQGVLDAILLSEFKLEEGDSIHVTKSRSNAEPSTSPSVAAKSIMSLVDFRK
jgi:hypothetical protein